MNVTERQIPPLLDHLYGSAETEALTFSKAILALEKPTPEKLSEIRTLLEWGRRGDTPRRRLIATAFRQRRLNVAMIHGIGEMTKADARAYMKDYFAVGGDVRSVAEWLQIAGGVLREHRSGKPPGTAGSVVKAVGGWMEDAVDAAADMINTVADALKAAAKSLGDAVAAALKWTLDKIADLVAALIEAGRSVGEILTEAAKKGLEAVAKFVKAVIRAAGAVRDVLAWAVSRAAATVEAVIRALREIGQQVVQIMSAAARLTAAGLRAVVRALVRIGTRIGDILVAVANRALSIVRTVLEGLLAIGLSLAQAVRAICHDVAEAFRRGFFQGLMALGKVPLQILKAALAAGAATLALAFAVFMEIWGGHRPLTPDELRKARRVFGSSIELSRVKIARANIAADVVNWLNGQRPFTTMYVINFSSRATVTMGTLIHELTHVWQAVVAGPIYMVEALHSQLFGRGYEVTDDDLVKAAGDLRKLEREQQAVVVERYWRGRWGGENYDWEKYEDLARQVYLRGRVLITDLDLRLPVAEAIGTIRPQTVRIR